MPQGVSVEVEDGAAFVTPELEQRGAVLAALTAHPGPIRTLTAGRRRTYKVTEAHARAAGLIDEPKKKAPAKKAPAKKAPAEDKAEA